LFPQTGVIAAASLALFALGGFFGVVEIAATAFATQAGMQEKTFHILCPYFAKYLIVLKV